MGEGCGVTDPKHREYTLADWLREIREKGSLPCPAEGPRREPQRPTPPSPVIGGEVPRVPGPDGSTGTERANACADAPPTALGVARVTKEEEQHG